MSNSETPVGLLQVSGVTHVWESGAWYAWKPRQETQTDRRPLRVFRFRGDAWQCPKDAASCFVETEDDDRLSRQAVIIMGQDGRPVTGEESPRLIIDAWRTKATRLSAWAEWFDVTLAGAADAYGKAALAALRVYMRHEPNNLAPEALRRSVAIEVAESYVRHAFAFGHLPRQPWMSPGVTPEYMAAVVADLEARLRGEPGHVVMP